MLPQFLHQDSKLLWNLLNVQKIGFFVILHELLPRKLAFVLRKKSAMGPQIASRESLATQKDQTWTAIRS